MNKAVSQALFEVQTRYLEGQVLETRKWHVFARAFPTLDVGFNDGGRPPLRIRLQCDDWNELPPSIELLSIEGEYLVNLPPNLPGVFNASAHPITKRPFVCMAGSREYHTHSSHVSDLWDNYKNKPGYDLGGILSQLWSAWLKSHQ